MKQIGIGDLVVSKQGRDKDTIYLVVDKLPNNYSLLCNGDNKKLDNPKKKIISHIKPLDTSSQTIKSKLLSNAKVFDSEVYSFIRKYKESLKNEVIINLLNKQN